MELKMLLDRVPKRVEEAFRHKIYKKGSQIILPGEKNDFLYILVSGEAEVYHQNYSGMMISLFLFKPYSCFGENEIFNSDVVTLGVAAKTDCDFLILAKPSVYEWMKADFEFNLYIIEQLVQKLFKSSERTRRLAFLSVKERFLYSIYTHYSIGDLESFTKAMLINETYAPARSLNRALAECKAEGLVGYERKRFSVILPERIADILDVLL